MNVDAIKLLNDVGQVLTEITRLKAKCEELENNSVEVAKFYNVLVTPSLIAKMYSVSKPTVIAYVRLGMIPMHPDSSDNMTLIRLSDALMLDFGKMRKGVRYGGEEYDTSSR